MNPRQERSAQLVRDAIQKSLIPRNQIASISGLTNTYIRDLEQGNIANVSREKLISFATAVNMTLEETDDLLTVFDRAKLITEDIPLFIQTAGQRKATSVVNVAREFFGYELVLLTAESVPGPKKVCTNHLTVILQPKGLRTYYVRTPGRPLHPIHLELKEAIGIERRRNLDKQLASYKMTHYIHLDYLRSYLLDCPEPEEKELRQKHVEEVIRYVDQYPNFELLVTEKVSSFNFLLKYDNKGASANHLFFYTLDLSRMQGRFDGQIIGFFTGNKVIIEQFAKDAELFDEQVMDQYRPKEKLIELLAGLVHRSKHT